MTQAAVAIPKVRPDWNTEGEEIARMAASACFEWVSDAIDRDGNQVGSTADEDAAWVQHHDEVERRLVELGVELPEIPVDADLEEVLF